MIDKAILTMNKWFAQHSQFPSTDNHLEVSEENTFSNSMEEAVNAMHCAQEVGIYFYNPFSK